MDTNKTIAGHMSGFLAISMPGDLGMHTITLYEECMYRLCWYILAERAMGDRRPLQDSGFATFRHTIAITPLVSPNLLISWNSRLTL